MREKLFACDLNDLDKLMVGELTREEYMEKHDSGKSIEIEVNEHTLVVRDLTVTFEVREHTATSKTQPSVVIWFEKESEPAKDRDVQWVGDLHPDLYNIMGCFDDGIIHLDGEAQDSLDDARHLYKLLKQLA